MEPPLHREVSMPSGSSCLLAMLLAGCGYEHAPRTGPLAALADSLFPPGVELKCRWDIPLLSDSLPRARFCQSPHSPNVLYVGRSGRILGVLMNWADDSAGTVRASDDSVFLSKVTGIEVARGEADATAEEHHWKTDTVCYSLNRAFDHHGYQEDWYLPERFGFCM
jgi:hypothetical protein